MQKKIIALAVAGLMSGAAFAQTNVTISGVLDVGVVNSKNEGANRSTNANYNNTATSNITFRATEALGGGMNAGMLLETDIRGGATFATFQRYVFINGGWGELSLGQRTNFSTTTATVAQPFSTSMGGGWSGVGTPFSFTRTRGGGFEAFGAYNASGRDVRADGSVRYDSPNFAGFTFGASWKPENDATGETQASNGHQNLGLNYANGPIRVSYAYAKISNAVHTDLVTLCTTLPCTLSDDAFPTVALAYDSSVKHNLLAANYTFGDFTLYGGYTTSKGDRVASPVGDDVDSRSWNIAAKWAATGNIDLMANYLKDNDKLSANADRKLFALGADYKFSKRTAAYVRYQTFDSNTNLAGGKNTTYGAGLRHAF